jgi:hypothetical protein
VTVTGIPSGVASAIYKTDRNGNFNYTFTGLMPSAYHKIDLHFAEISLTAAGQRKFDVAINGQLMLNDLDIIAAAGGAKKALARTFVLKADSTGKVVIQFTGVVGSAKINGLVISKQIASTIYDNDGDGVLDAQDPFPGNSAEWKDTDGDGFGDNSDVFPTDPLEWADSNGDGVGDNTVLGALQRLRAINSGGVTTGAFLADNSFTGGGTFSRSVTVTGIPSGVATAIFRTERNGNFTYTLTGLNVAAFHRVELYFAEIWHTSAGKRKFDVFVNDKLVLDDFDVFLAAGGANKALARGFTVKPDSTGKVTIRFASVVGQAKLSGLALFQHLPVTAAKSAAVGSADSGVGAGGGVGGVDTDNDGAVDSLDAFPLNPSESADRDGDGVGDNMDLFPGHRSSMGMGSYTLLLPAPKGAVNVGNGYGFLTLNSKLVGQLSVTMGDGSRFEQAVKVVNRTLTVEAMGAGQLATNTLTGSLTWVVQSGISDFQGSLEWARPGIAPLSLPTIGALYAPASLQTQLGKTSVKVGLVGKSLTVDQAGRVAGNRLTWSLSSTAGSYDPNTGLVVWTVTPVKGKTVTIRAVFFDDQNLIGGYYHDGASEFGAVQIIP